MKEGVRLTFKGVPQKKRRKILKVLETLGLTEINSQHDDHNDRHSYEMHLDKEAVDSVVVEELDELEEPFFKVEAGVGC